jgi:aryl-alcohol dehydrogenase-like predicted oxidoreductase
MTLGEADESSFLHGIGCDEKTAFRIMDHALDLGINFFDTADVYGQDGMVEKLIGKWFTQSQKRDRVILATKFRFRTGDGVNDSGASRFHIMRAVEASLKRLNTDRVELYQIHAQDMETSEDETLRALDDLVRQGKVCYLGASNYAAYRLTESVMHSRAQKYASFVTLQAQYNLVIRELEREHIPMCQRFGLGLLPWSPLAGGFLSGKYRRDSAKPDNARLTVKDERFKKLDTERNWMVLEELCALSQETDHSASALALAWLLRKPTVSSVIFGARSVEQLEANFKAATIDLPQNVFDRLDKVSALKRDYPYDFLHKVQGTW